MAGPSPDKVVVTHVAALKAKYGNRYKGIDAAVASLVAADQARGLKTVVVDLSSAADARKYKFTAIPIADMGNARLFKQAIDRVYAAADQPPYLMILGSVDVVPHVPLKNPIHIPDKDGEYDDPDAVVPSDLPYACDATYSTDTRKFISPSRVVGRLPDVTKHSDPAYLTGVLETAANYTPRAKTAYDNHMGLSAAVWQVSSQLTLDHVFGGHVALRLSPPTQSPWPAADLSALGNLSHFINCHGAAGSPEFFGQDQYGYVTAIQAAELTAHVNEGTVAATECCYGAELYDPAVSGGQMGICNTYLQEKAYGYFGSTTVAYGPVDKNDQADLMCRYFLGHVREGASLGRSALAARLDYVSQAHTMTPTDLKTLAQFTLLGDPSLTPVKAPTPAATKFEAVLTKPMPKGLAGDAAAAATRFAIERLTRDGRREWLRKYSEAIAMTVSVAADAVADWLVPHAAATRKGHKARPVTGSSNRAVADALRTCAREMGLKSPTVVAYDLTGAAGPFRSAKSAAKSIMAAHTAVDARVHLVIESQPERVKAHKDARELPRLEKLQFICGFEAVEYDGALEIRKFVRR